MVLLVLSIFVWMSPVARKKLKKSLDKRAILCYIVCMNVEYMKKHIFPVGTNVRHKRNPSIKGTVVGKAFGTPAKQNIRLQLKCGLTFDVSPYAIEKMP
jgi:hypothetical protein